MQRFVKVLRPMLAVGSIGVCWVCFALPRGDAQQNAGAAPKKPAGAAVPVGKPADKPADAARPKSDPAQKLQAGDNSNAAAADATDETPIRDSAAAFTKAYNAHDAKKVAELFALKAEITDENGTIVKGRDAIELDFARTFTQFPESSVEIDIDSIRFLTPNIAVEEGIVRGWQTPDEDANVMTYIAVHVKVDGQWLVASVSDFELPGELSPHDHLLELAWMVGDWIEESPDSSIKSSVKWDETGNFLIQDFALHARGGAYANGSMRIGWDAALGQFKSWSFNADGGHSEGFWVKDGDSWVVKTQGVNAKGETTSSTSVYRYIDNDTLTWRAYDRVVAGKFLDPLPEFVVKRHAPPPAH